MARFAFKEAFEDKADRTVDALKAVIGLKFSYDGCSEIFRNSKLKYFPSKYLLMGMMEIYADLRDARIPALNGVFKAQGVALKGLATYIFLSIENNNSRGLKELHNPSYIAEDITEEEDPCWDDYHMFGMKKKGNREVPNCVPDEPKK
jgi:hypothetical protein